VTVCYICGSYPHK